MLLTTLRGPRCRRRMVVGFTTTYAISIYHHWCCEFKSRSERGVQHYVIKFVSDLLWFSPGTPVSSTSKTDHHDITEILLKVALNTIKNKHKDLKICNMQIERSNTQAIDCKQCQSPLMLWVWIPLQRGVLDTTLCDKFCQWLATGWWFSLGILVSSTNKNDS